jgi:quercetin dioxygenase-like cupin family protein
MLFRTALPVLCATAAGVFAVETVKTPIDNDYVRVLDVVVQPHEKTALHEHKANRVMIYRNAGSQNIDYEGGRRVTLTFGENQVMWAPIEGMHTSEISSEKPVNIVEVELKKPSGGKKITTAMDPLKVDPKHYRLEFENDQVRVFRVHIGPHESTPMHEHQLHRIVVYLTDATVRVTGADGKVETSAHKAGDIVESGAARHGEQNLTGNAIETIVTELKY